MNFKFSIFLLATTLAVGQAAMACMCYSKPEKEKAFQRADFAILAKVTSAEKTSLVIPARPNSTIPERTIPASKYTLETIEQFKGISRAQHEILSRQTSCFVDLEPEREYLIYVNAGSNGSLAEIGSCDRVLPAETAQEDLEYLKDLQK